MEDISIILKIIQKYGWPSSSLVLILYFAYKEIYVLWKKKNGRYVSFSNLDKFQNEIKKRIEDLEKMQTHQVVLIEKRASEIETLRIVQEQTAIYLKESIQKTSEDVKEIKADMRDIKNLLIKRNNNNDN